MGDELPSNVTVDGAYDGALCCVLNFESGASPELYEEKMLRLAMRPVRPRSCMINLCRRVGHFRPRVLRRTTRNIGSRCFAPMSRKAERGFSCFSYAAYQQRRFGYFAAEHAALSSRSTRTVAAIVSGRAR